MTDNKPLTPFFVNVPKRDENSTIVLLLDESRGIYIPKAFYDGFDFASWGLNVSEYRDLSSPDNDLYWDTWDALLRDAEHHEAPKQGEAIGHVWTLYQNGSLFAVRDDHRWDDEEHNEGDNNE